MWSEVHGDCALISVGSRVPLHESMSQVDCALRPDSHRMGVSPCYEMGTSRRGAKHSFGSLVALDLCVLPTE